MNPKPKRPEDPSTATLSDYVVPSYAPSRPNKLLVVLKWVKIIVFTLIALALTVGLWGNSRWSWDTHRRMQGLEAATQPVKARPERYNDAELAPLPPMVRRYFVKVLNPNQPIVRRLYLEQTGRFNRSFIDDQWEPFTARQRVSTNRPGFVWDASMTMSPGITVRVVDAYVAGVGSVQPSVFGLFDLDGSHDTLDIARSELIRYFTEAVWYPTALLPSQGVRWTPVNDQTAQASLTDGPLTVTVTFHFDAQGLVERISSIERSALVDGLMVVIPWEVRLSNYQTQSGMLVPHEAEVAWLHTTGRMPYWRGKVEKFDYELPR
ncbi:MAG: DUF6544 family protein [Burkholderiales bacterium]